MLRNTLSNLRTVSKNKLRKLVRKYGISNKDEFIHDMQEAAQDELFGTNATDTANRASGPANAGQSSRNRWSATTRFALQTTIPGPSVPARPPSVLQQVPVQVMASVPEPSPVPVIDYSDVIIQETSQVISPGPMSRPFYPVPEIDNDMTIDTSPLMDPEDMEIYTEAVSSAQDDPMSMAVDSESIGTTHPSLSGVNSVSFWPHVFPQSPSFPSHYPNMDGMGGGMTPAFVIVPGDFSASLKRSLPVFGASNAPDPVFAYPVPLTNIGTITLEQRVPEVPNPGFGPVWRKDELSGHQGATSIEMGQAQIPTPMPLASDRPASLANSSSAPMLGNGRTHDGYPSTGPAPVPPLGPVATNGRPSFNGPAAARLTVVPPADPVAINDGRREGHSFNRPATPLLSVIPPVPVPVAADDGRSEERSSFNHLSAPLPAPLLPPDDRDDGPSVPHHQPTSPTTTGPNGNHENQDQDDNDEDEDEDEPRAPFEREDTAPLEEGEDKPPAVFLTSDQLPSVGSLSDEHATPASAEQGEVHETSPGVAARQVAHETGARLATTPPQRVEHYQRQGHAGLSRDETTRGIIAQRRLAIRSGQDLPLFQSSNRVERDDDDDVRPERSGSAKRVRSNTGAARSPGASEAELPGPSRRVSTWERRSSNRWSRTSNEVTPLRSILRNRNTPSNHAPSTSRPSSAGPSLPFTFTFGVSGAPSGCASSSAQRSIPTWDEELYLSNAPTVEQAPVSSADSQTSDAALAPLRYTDGPLPPLEDLLRGMTVDNRPQRPPRSVSFAVLDGPEQSILRQRSSMVSREARNRSIRGRTVLSRRENSIHDMVGQMDTTDERGARGARAHLARPSGFNRLKVRSRTSRVT
ncbi:hypothetical protein F5I97DRAFT_1108479 [Phlebopus sp. FC_14]|nr:hypothetical protein F5I97DRAFT_1108479 [Phlebopus sp. FC_14]